MKEKLLASAALVLLACTPAMAQGLDDVKHKFASVSGIVQDKCMACHSRGYDLPFYAKVPGISAIIEKDYRDGIRAMDLNQELVQRKDRPVGETVLAKMEWVILNDTMPPAKFAVVHWGSRLSDQDKKDSLTWVAQTRKAHYATDAAPEHANEPIQPIPHRLPVDEAKVALGKTLFNDARLSADSTVTTLDEAVRIMGIYCSGLDVPQKDRALIVGFLRTLTGQHEGRPVQGEAVAR